MREYLMLRWQCGMDICTEFLLGEIKEAAILNTNFNLDRSCLRFLVSGGEGNIVETCDVLIHYLGKYGAPPHAISTASGMSQTCAGSLYNPDCPRYDVLNMQQFCSLGRCVPRIEMRVTIPMAGEDKAYASVNELGLLEVRGPIVFQGYVNNKSATTASFAPDGWFRTGDHSTIDRAGKLCLASPNELEAAIENAESEQIEAVYLSSFGTQDLNARIIARDAIVQATIYILALDLQSCN
ncbi:hypothetical protein EAF00_006108 [Botryotinia globosa]|nr:hypothetical protein EAF00_006108 [Botryotinia globosa]